MGEGKVDGSPSKVQERGSAPFRLIPFPNPNPRLGTMGLGEMGGHQEWSPGKGRS